MAATPIIRRVFTRQVGKTTAYTFRYQYLDSYAYARQLLIRLNPETVADAPCGTGRNLGWLACDGRRASPRRTIGVDVDGNSCKIAKRYAPYADIIRADFSTFVPRRPAGLLYLQGLNAGNPGPRAILKHLSAWAPTILIHEAEAEFSQDEILDALSPEYELIASQWYPETAAHRGNPVWVSLWYLRPSVIHLTGTLGRVPKTKFSLIGNPVSRSKVRGGSTRILEYSGRQAPGGEILDPGTALDWDSGLSPRNLQVVAPSLPSQVRHLYLVRLFMPSLSDALDYARAGVKIFPCRPRDKPPLTEHGFKEASLDEGLITLWWSKWPDANIGAPTGANGWTVLDIDTESRDEIANILAVLGFELPRTPLSKTGKGRQVFFRAVSGVGPSVSIMDSVDVRSAESYVILPPSIHPNGKTYTWQVPLSDGLAEMPASIVLKLARVREPARVDIEGPKLAVGARHNELFRIARVLASRGTVESAVLEQLRAVNEARCDPPLPDEELVKTARGSDRYGYKEESAIALPVATSEKEKVEDETPPTPLKKEKVEDKPPPTTLEVAAIFSDLVKTYKTLVYFPDAWTYRMTALFVIQTYLKPILSSAWYIGFVGPKASGKTTALEVTCALSMDGVLSSNLSPAAGARMAVTRTLFVDEVDEMRGDMAQVMEGILRSGYRRGTPYIRCVGKDNHPVEYDVFGPKGYSLRGETEDALMSRTYAARTEAAPKESATRMLIANANRDFTVLKQRLASLASPAFLESVRDSLAGIWESDGFYNRVEALMANGALPRDIELAAVCLSMAESLGIDISQDVQSAMDAQITYESGEIEDFKDEVAAIWISLGKPIIMKRIELRNSLNTARAERREAAIGKKMFGKMLRELGARDGVELKRAGRGSKHMVYFSPEFRKALEDDGLVSTSVPDVLSNTDNQKQTLLPNPDINDTDRERKREREERGEVSTVFGAVPLVRYLKDDLSVSKVSPDTPTLSQSERFIAILRLAKALSKIHTDFSFEDLRDRAALLGISDSEVSSILTHLRRDGSVMEPRLDSGRYRAT